MSDPSHRPKRAEDVSPALDGVETLQLVSEALQVTKQQVTTGTVRVSTRTETHQEMAEIGLDRSVVEVTRVPIGKVVDVAPQVRTENDMTIVPVFEERFVVVKELFLKEELHIRHRVEHELSRTPVDLRRQVATVERIDAEGSAARGEIDPGQDGKRAHAAPAMEH